MFGIIVCHFCAIVKMFGIIVQNSAPLLCKVFQTTQSNTNRIIVMPQHTHCLENTLRIKGSTPYMINTILHTLDNQHSIAHPRWSAEYCTPLMINKVLHTLDDPQSIAHPSWQAHPSLGGVRYCAVRLWWRGVPELYCHLHHLYWTLRSTLTLRDEL